MGVGPGASEGRAGVEEFQRYHQCSFGRPNRVAKQSSASRLRLCHRAHRGAGVGEQGGRRRRDRCRCSAAYGLSAASIQGSAGRGPFRGGNNPVGRERESRDGYDGRSRADCRSVMVRRCWALRRAAARASCFPKDLRWKPQRGGDSRFLAWEHKKGQTVAYADNLCKPLTGLRRGGENRSVPCPFQEPRPEVCQRCCAWPTDQDGDDPVSYPFLHQDIYLPW